MACEMSLDLCFDFAARNSCELGFAEFLFSGLLEFAVGSCEVDCFRLSSLLSWKLLFCLGSCHAFLARLAFGERLFDEEILKLDLWLLLALLLMASEIFAIFCWLRLSEYSLHFDFQGKTCFEWKASDSNWSRNLVENQNQLNWNS